MIKFPDNFDFGSSTSATQTEGSKNGISGETIWDHLFQIKPDLFFNKMGPYKTSNFFNDYKTDIEFLEKTGHTAFRTSISWARLIPDGIGEVNQEAVDFYKDVFKRIKEKNIELYINLFHFDMPMKLQDIGGWENRKVVDAFAEYAKICFENFGDYVDIWFTFNEPIVHTECGYLKQFHYPMLVDSKKYIQVGYNTQLASSKAIEAFRETKLDSKIGIILNLSLAYPRSESDQEDVKAARIAQLFQNRSFLDPSIKGHFNQELVDLVMENDMTPYYEEEDLKIIKDNTIDILGVNYYQPMRVKKKKDEYEGIFRPEKYYDDYNKEGIRINPYRGWEIYPQGIYDIAMDIKENYGNIDWIVTENGIGVENEERFEKDGLIEDDYRIDFFKDHLSYIHKAMEEGANCHGYMVWTFIDCWSWLNEYKNRYGLVELDLKTGEKKLKKSGYWFKKLSENKGF